MFQLKGRIQHYAWGSPTAIPSILGTEPTGEPQAEYWLGTHRSGPADIIGDGDLRSYVEANPGVIGERSTEAFGPRLPYLMKVLAADQPLSLQAHPSREQAEDGFARENAAGVPLDSPERTYRDDWPKPELTLALTTFDALNGFREPTETADLFDGLGVWHALTSLLGPLRNRKGAAAIAEVFLEALSGGELQEQYALEVVAAAHKHAAEDSPVGEFARTALELNTYYPASPGIIAGLLCNRISLIPGQAMYLPAGNMHAYLRGTGIEIMANSDNVLRGGLTHKHIDVPELVRVVSFEPGLPNLIHGQSQGPGLTYYPTDAPEFALWQMMVSPAQPVTAPAHDGPRIVLVIDGEVTADDGSVLRQGDALFAAAGEDLTLRGDGMAMLGAPGVCVAPVTGN